MGGCSSKSDTTNPQSVMTLAMQYAYCSEFNIFQEFMRVHASSIDLTYQPGPGTPPFKDPLTNGNVAIEGFTILLMTVRRPKIKLRIEHLQCVLDHARMKGPDVLHTIVTQTHSNETALTWAATANVGSEAEQAIKLLLHGGSEVDHAHDAGKTPLMLCSQRGHLGAIKLLIEYGANVNAQTDQLYAPLAFAAMGGHAHVMEFLIESGARINDNGVPPLLMSAQEGHLECAKLLVARGAAINAHPPESLMTPLLEASYSGHAQIVEFLLRSGADPQLRASNGKIAEQLAGLSPKHKCTKAQRDAVLEVFKHYKASLPPTPEELLQQAQIKKSGIDACTSLSVRIAKLALLPSSILSTGVIGVDSEIQQSSTGTPIGIKLIDRRDLESILFETLSILPIVTYLSSPSSSTTMMSNETSSSPSSLLSSSNNSNNNSSLISAAHYGMELSDYMIPRLKPFLDEPVSIIQDEIKRLAYAFMKIQENKISSSTVPGALKSTNQLTINASKIN